MFREIKNNYLKILKQLREDGKAFSKENPEIAYLLDFNPQRSNDPETERMIESFAYMYADIDYKIENTYSNFQENFARSLFPEIVSPIPASTILKLKPNLGALKKKPDGLFIKKGTDFYTQDKGLNKYHFKSVRDVNVHDIDVPFSYYSKIKLSNVPDNYYGSDAIQISLSVGENIPQYALRDEHSMDFFINSELENAFCIYDNIFSDNRDLVLFNKTSHKVSMIKRSDLEPVCDSFYYFSSLNSHNYIYPLFEFCNFIHKFLFFRVKFKKEYFSEPGPYTLILPVSKGSIKYFDDDSIQSSCVPIVNAFEKKLEPLIVSDNKFEYEVSSGAKKLSGNNEILNMEKVEAKSLGDDNIFEVKKFEDTAAMSDFSWSFHQDILNKVFVSIINKEGIYNSLGNLEFLYPIATCKNIYGAESFKTFQDYKCNDHSDDVTCQSLFNPITPNYVKTKFGGKYIVNYIKSIFDENEKIALSQFSNINNTIQLLKLFSKNYEAFSNILDRIISKIVKIESSYINDRIHAEKRTYHILCLEFKIHFRTDGTNYSGEIFLKNFLNFYFDQVRPFNLRIRVDVKFL